MEIAYEDGNIIICNKPAGTASQSEKSFDVDLLSSVMTYVKENSGSSYAAIINRLDKPVGGLVLFAKNRNTAGLLSALSGEHSIEKYYYAVVSGSFKDDKGEFEDYLLKDGKTNTSKTVKSDTPGAKKARLRYERLESKVIDGQEYTLLRIRLLTGRHHQIRVQMSSNGHPLYGDIKYNSDFADKRGVFPALFAYRLCFNNPSGADKIAVEVRPSGDIWNKFEYFRQN